VKKDLINRRTFVLPEYDSKKTDLPKREKYIGSVSWLKAIQDRIDEDFVFALDQALILISRF
jgi:hypothetical protein